MSAARGLLYLLFGVLLAGVGVAAQAPGPLQELQQIDIDGKAPLKGRAAIAAWFRRMAGRYLVQGTLLRPDGRIVAVSGMVDCQVFGTGPGLQCVLSVQSDDGSTHLSPGVFLFGFDLDQPRIRYQSIDDLGIAESATAPLKGSTATFRAPCIVPINNCFRGTSITANPRSDTVRMEVDIEQGRRVTTHYDIAMSRLPKGRTMSPLSLPATVVASAVGSDDTPVEETVSTEADETLLTGKYEEPLCQPLAGLRDLEAAYTPELLRQTVEELARRRYPYGLEAIRGQTDEQLGRWFSSTATFSDVVAGFSAAVHEGMHIWGSAHSSGFYNHAYRVRDDLIITTRQLPNFNRSEILQIHPDAKGDPYTQSYLQGPSGAQGFNTLLDEFNAYVHSLAASYCLRDQMPPGQRISARDGALAMMYYVEAYLQLARTRHPGDYLAIQSDRDQVRLIFALWSRATFYLDLTRSMPELGIRDAAISKWVLDPRNLGEIDGLRPAR